MCSVHGDDFTTAGAKPDLDWFEKELEARYELRKVGRIGPGEHDDKVGRVLNRVVRWTTHGLGTRQTRVRLSDSLNPKVLMAHAIVL